MTGKDLTGPAMRAAIAALQARASAAGPGADPRAHHRHPGRRRRGLIIEVPLAGNGGAAPSNSALLGCATRSCPRRWEESAAISYAVAGDHRRFLRRRRGLDAQRHGGGRFVVLLAFVLLLVALRSVAISLVSIALNLFSVGAGYGADHADLPERPAAGAAGLHVLRRDHLLDPAVHVRAPVRA